MRAIGSRRMGLAVAPLATVLSVTGCGRTLVLVERTGFNMSIAVRPSEATPVDVNFGLDRKVASIVPPTGDAAPKDPTDGEAVNMFAGFRASYDAGGTATAVLPLQGDLTIRTQFASGAAALGIATKPDVAVKVMDVSGRIPHDRPRSAETIKTWGDLETAIRSLSGVQWVRLANDMRPNLATRSPAFRRAVSAWAPDNKPFGTTANQQEAALRFLLFWVQSEIDTTPENLDQWKAAIKVASL